MQMKMKKIVVIGMLLLLPGIAGTLQAQWIYGALSAGVNLTQVDGDEEIGYKKIGFNGGPSVIKPFGKNRNWSVTMELLFSMKGARQKSNYPAIYQPNDTIKDTVNYNDGYKLDLNYVEIPLMVHYTDKKIIAAGLGFSYGQRVGFKEMVDHNKLPDPEGWETPADSSSLYANYDLNILADVRLRIWQRLWLNGRFSYSILPIATRWFRVPSTPTDQIWSREQYNNVITLRLTYIFNEPLQAKNKKNKSGK